MLTYYNNLKSDSINEQLYSNLIEVIIKDTLFINMLKYNNVQISFYIDDTSCAPVINIDDVRILYPDSSQIYIYNKKRYLFDWYKRESKIYKNIPHKYKNDSSNFILCFDFMDYDVIGLLLFPRESNNIFKYYKPLQYYILIDKNMNIIKYTSRVYGYSD